MGIKHTEEVAMYSCSFLLTRDANRKPVRISLSRVFPHDGHSRLSWDARSTLSSEIN